jgi:hypothetical protein
MGCNSSHLLPEVAAVAAPPPAPIKKDSVVQEKKTSIVDSTPKLSEGCFVKNFDPHGGANVIFLFGSIAFLSILIVGGPGAFKGFVIELMCQEFGFVSLSLEKIITAHLRKEASDGTKSRQASTTEIWNYMTQHPNAVTMVMNRLTDVTHLSGERTSARFRANENVNRKELRR